jgi:hypothetical protein
MQNLIKWLGLPLLKWIITELFKLGVKAYEKSKQRVKQKQLDKSNAKAKSKNLKDRLDANEDSENIINS